MKPGTQVIANAELLDQIQSMQTTINAQQAVIDILKYQLGMAEVERAKNNYNYAGSSLELKRIKCRLAEIKSQHEPLASIVGISSTEPGYKEMRDKLYAAAFYVVVGRVEEGK